MKILWIGVLVLALAATVVTSFNSRMAGSAQVESKSPAATALPAAACRFKRILSVRLCVPACARPVDPELLFSAHI